MKRLNEKQWRDEKELRDAVLLKAVDTVITESDEERVLDFRISTETVDSYNDVIKAEGWDLERFKKNPVVLWAHSHYQPPVGKALSVGVDGTDLVASAKFADAETYAFADTIYRLLKSGYLRATSVGFFPKEWTYDEDRGGYNFISQELFEFSVVPVPANPDALGLAVKSGIDCAPLKEWAEKTLDMWTPDDSVALWVPKAQIEDVYKSLSGPVTVSDPFDGTKAAVIEETVEDVVDPDDVIETVEAALDAPPVSIEVVEEGEVEKLNERLDIQSDEIEDLKAQVDQLLAKIATDEQEKKEEIEKAEAAEHALFDVIDIQPIDSTKVEGEVDRSILDLEIDPEMLQSAIRRQLEQELMKKTGKLPKEV